MADKTKIEWTDATWTPIRARVFAIQNDGSGKERIGWHCEHASEGCRFCYAETLNVRLGTGLEFKPGNLYREERKGYANGEAKVFLDDKMLLKPLQWRKPRRIFVCSMTDLFADFVKDDWIDRMFAVMALAPQHTFQVLTKRPERMRAYLSDPGTEARVAKVSVRLVPLSLKRTDLDIEIQVDATSGFHKWPLANVWLGASAEDQPAADARIPHLLATPAVVRFLSLEPLLGPIDLADCLSDGIPSREQVYGPNGLHFIRHGAPRIDWVIVGSESGPNARPCNLDWVRSIRDQCAAPGVALFWKQHIANGKKIGLPELDGITHDAFPEPSP